MMARTFVKERFLRQVNIHANITDTLSDKGYAILGINAAGAYGKLVTRGEGNLEGRMLLDKVTPGELVSKPVVDEDHARAMLCGLWLWHDWLDQSHAISQDMGNATGSFWHAILHRREGDFDNAKYWFARCRNHPVLGQMTAMASEMLHPLPANKSYLRLVKQAWDSDAFVDLCEEIWDSPNDERYAVAVGLQRLEWKLLFDYCTRQAAQ